MSISVSSKAEYIVRRSNGTFLKKNANSSAGIFQRGTKIDDLDKLASNIGRVNIGVGWSSGSIHSSGLSYAYLASILEQGTKDGRIPPRPYLKLSGRIVAESLNKQIKASLAKMMSNSTSLTIVNIKRQLGDVSKVAEVKTKKIIRQRAVPVIDNALSTIKKKNSNTPWINSGELLNALTAKVNIVKSI